MAFITRDSVGVDESMMPPQPPSFMTTNDSDPFSSVAGAGVSVNWDAKRNILEDLNNAENTFLPPPPDKESLAVYLRVKPVTQYENDLVKENKAGDVVENIVKIENEYQIALLAPKESNTYKNSVNGVGAMTHRFSFTKIFKPKASQSDMFVEIVEPRVKDFLEGQNQLLFTYGATSSGKTFTIQGVDGNIGIMPRAIDAIFNTIGPKHSADVPLQPMGFCRVVKLTRSEMEELRREKDSVFRLGLELMKEGKSCARPVSPDDSMVSTASSVASSIGSMISSHDAGRGTVLDLAQLASLFPGLEGRERETATIPIKDTDITYSVWVSFAEIYNENIYDLLCKVPVAKKKGDKAVKRPTLKLTDDKNGSTFIKGLREVRVSSADEAYQTLMIGRKNLHFAATRLNQQSSRSHCIFTVKVVRVADPAQPHLARVSMLSFCDLAGSERISKTHNVGDRQKEAGNINTSLLVLGRCIKAIRQNQLSKDKNDKKQLKIVPFRESKLTRLFKSFFSGLGKLSLIVCISQAQYLFDETVHVCKFASIASKVTVETVKLPPPKPKASRFSSMIAGGLKTLQSLGDGSILSGRGSIAWEAPHRNKSSLLPASFNPAARSTIVGEAPPRLSTFMNNINENEREDEESVLENTVVQTQYDALLELVEDLKQKLVEERKKNVTLERDLREELCEEFNQLLVEVEDSWEQRLREEKEEVEKRAEWRVDEIQEVHRNRNKRRRENCPDFDQEMAGFRAGAALEQKEKQVVNLEQELEEMKQQVTAMKETTVKSKEAQDSLQLANSKLQFELAEQQRLAAELGRELGVVKERLDQEQKTNIEAREGEGDVMLGLERSLAHTREELAKRDNEVSDLNDLIQEAGDEFMAKEAELKDLETLANEREDQLTQQGIVLQDLQGQLEESHMMLQEVNIQLEEKEQRLEETEGELEKEKGRDEIVAKLRRRVGELEGESRLLSEKCTAAEGYSEELKETLEACEKVVEEQMGRVKEAEEKMLEAQSERNELLKYKSQAYEQIAELKENKLSSSQELEVGVENFDLKQRVDTLTEQNKKLTEVNSSLEKKNAGSQEEIDTLTLKVDELKRATSVDESLLEVDEAERAEEVKNLLRVKDELETELKRSSEEVVKLKEVVNQTSKDDEQRVAVETLKLENEKIQDKFNLQLTESEKKLMESRERFDTMTKKIEEYERLLKDKESKILEMCDAVKNKDEELNAAEKVIEDVTECSLKDKETIEHISSEVKNFEKEVATLKNAEESLKNELTSVRKEKENTEEKLNILKTSDSGITNKEDSLKLVELETRGDSLEKELATKDNYIKELEDIIVEKEFKISELEASPTPSNDTTDAAGKMDILQKDLKKVCEEKVSIEDKLKLEYEAKKELQKQIEELNAKLAETDEMKNHQEKMRCQRDALEKRVLDCEKSAKRLEETEDELRKIGGEKSELERKLSVADEKNNRLKATVEEAKGEIKMLKIATKNSARESQEIAEVKAVNSELEREVSRLKPLTEAHKREDMALEVLRKELENKSSEISSLKENVTYLRSSVEAKEYELGKTKEDREKLMAHYENLFRTKQQELDKEKARNGDTLKLGEAWAKATPTKSNELREKLVRAESDLKEMRSLMARAEEEISELKGECRKLQKELDTKVSQHEREKNRTKLATQKLVAEYKDTNKELQRRLEGGTSSADNSTVELSTLEADDSKTDNSLIEVTPVVKKGRGRGRTKGNRTNQSNASLASFEDSNTENEVPEVGRPRVASVSRKARVTRKNSFKKDDKNVSVEEEEIKAEACRSTSRKRSVATRNVSETSVLRSLQTSTLSPVVEGRTSANNSLDTSLAVFLTPAVKKKRKLYSVTPQHSEEFTPPTPNQDHDTPGSVVKRQLRARQSKKK